MQVGIRRVLTLERVLQQNRSAVDEFSESAPDTRVSSGRSWQAAALDRRPRRLCARSSSETVSPVFTVVCVAVSVTQRQNQVVTTETDAPQSLKCLLSDPVQVKFTNTCLKGFGKRQN